MESKRKTKGEESGQDARDTHGLEARATLWALCLCASVVIPSAGCAVRASRGAAATGAAIAAVDDRAAKIAEPLIRAEVRRETIEEQTVAVSKAATPAQATAVQVIARQAQAQKSDLAEAKRAVADTQSAAGVAAERAKAAEALAATLEGKWYVVWGVRIERAIWGIAIGWIVLNALAFAGGVGSPAGWLGWAAKQLRLFLPGMNPASWALNFYSSRRAA